MDNHIVSCLCSNEIDFISRFYVAIKTSPTKNPWRKPSKQIDICHSAPLCCALNAGTCSKTLWIFMSMVWPLNGAQVSVLQPALLAVNDSVSLHPHPQCQVIIRGKIEYWCWEYRAEGIYFSCLQKMNCISSTCSVLNRHTLSESCLLFPHKNVTCASIYCACVKINKI